MTWRDRLLWVALGLLALGAAFFFVGRWFLRAIDGRSRKSAD